MAFENKFVQQRIEKAELLRKEGINPYSNNSKRNATIEKFLNVNNDIERIDIEKDFDNLLALFSISGFERSESSINVTILFNVECSKSFITLLCCPPW